MICGGSFSSLRGCSVAQLVVALWSQLRSVITAKVWVIFVHLAMVESSQSLV